MKKKKKIKRNTIIICLIIWAITFSLSYMLPIENLFYDFKSPKDVFRYKYYGQITDVKEGDYSAMVFYINDKNENLFEIVSKDENGWKIGTYFSYKKVFTNQFDSVTLSVYNYRNSNDYYVVIKESFVEQNKKPSTIIDSTNTEFKYFTENIKNTDMQSITYYGYTRNFTENYSITINGETYEFFNE